VRNTVENNFNCPILVKSANSPVISGLHLFQVSFNPHTPRIRVIIEAEGNLKVINVNNSTYITFCRVVFEVGSPGVINCLSFHFLSGLFSEYWDTAALMSEFASLLIIFTAFLTVGTVLRKTTF
jgi:hypothetical protein